VIADFRGQLADCFAAHGVPSPDATAAVVAGAIDGVLLHRALVPGPGGGELAVVLRRLLKTETEGAQ
jgi:hypothetical protein